jgi:AcrR family transcriptional regulator
MPEVLDQLPRLLPLQHERRGGTSKDGRRERTKAALVQAGQALFSQRSTEAVSVDNIVQAAAVSKGSFYNHFEDKDALIREVAMLVRTDVETQVAAANVDVSDAPRRSARAMCVYARMALDDPERGRLIAKLLTQDMSAEAPINRGLVDDTGRGLADGRYGIATVEMGVIFTLGITQALVARVLLEQSRLGALSIAQQLVTLKLRGLGLPSLEAEMIAAQAADDVIRSA